MGDQDESILLASGASDAEVDVVQARLMRHMGAMVDAAQDSAEAALNSAKAATIAAEEARDAAATAKKDAIEGIDEAALGMAFMIAVAACALVAIVTPIGRFVPGLLKLFEPLPSE